MRSLTKKMHKGQKGLTLIELLIVVAILGIIAAVVIPNLGAFMITGKISAANTEVENVKTASLAYYAENEAWPPTNTDDPEFMRFIAGNLTGTYRFHQVEGWVIDGTGWQPELAWIEGTGHGKWGRP